MNFPSNPPGMHLEFQRENKKHASVCSQVEWTVSSFIWMCFQKYYLGYPVGKSFNFFELIFSFAKRNNTHLLDLCWGLNKRKSMLRVYYHSENKFEKRIAFAIASKRIQYLRINITRFKTLILKTTKQVGPLIAQLVQHRTVEDKNYRTCWKKLK